MVGECSRGHVGAQIIVRTTEDNKAFDMKVELHQGSVLSPLNYFVRVMEIITTEL